MSDEEFCSEYIASFDASPTDNTGCLIVVALFLIPFFICFVIVSLIKQDKDIFAASAVLGLLIVLALHLPVSEYIRKRNFLIKVGLNEKQAKRRYEFIKYKKQYMPLVQRMCRLNMHPILKQLDLLESTFRSANVFLSEFVFEREYTDEEYEDSINQMKHQLSKEEIDTIIEFLFQIAVLEDGIKDDEWELLMSIMNNIYPYKLGDFYAKIKIESFVKKYTPFRRSFADDAKDEKTEESQRRLVPPHLKPYYAILGLDDNASDKDIKRAYHNLALQYHPDLIKNADRVKECEAKMVKINEAYEKIRG